MQIVRISYNNYLHPWCLSGKHIWIISIQKK